MGAFIDLTILLAVVGAARAGWRRGLVFCLIDLIGFSGSVLAAVRFHEIPGAFFEFFGLSQTKADVVGGLAIFVPLIVATAIVGSRASKAVFKPGIFTTNRVLGAAFGAILALTIVVVGLLFARSAKLPFGVGRLVETSTIAPRVLRAAAPGVRVLDRDLHLDLCGGRSARALPEICRHHR
jgi:uncharacterized membrane protein required for colicin V production